MKRFFISFLVLMSVHVAVSAQVFYGTTDLKLFRDGRDKELRSDKESPLKAEDFNVFKGLDYFKTDPVYRVKAKFSTTPGEKFFMMPTSSGKSARYIKYGVLSFKLNGKPFQLSVYKPDPDDLKDFPEYKDILLIPFFDLSNKTETYSGGRYMNLIHPLGKSVVLDFNLSYSPSCSYGSGRYNCPVPPRENSLALEIRAGEKRFEYFGQKH